ncbi:MAG: hypothetical protein SVZ03_11965 [Spirochaetota bacterium]|nr:hypothetical protein [Spirochaetota bacterium]
MINSNNWTNEFAKGKYIQTAKAICNDHDPVYLGLGIEVNTYYETDSKDFDRFVTFISPLTMKLNQIFHMLMPDIRK